MKKNVWMSAVPALLLALVLAAGCKQPTVENGPVPVSGVTLDSTECLLIVGDTVTLTATVVPENAAVQTVTWSAEPEGVVTLKADGNSCSVTAESTGTATVTVTTDGGGKTAQCTVTVGEKQIPVTGVTLDSTKCPLIVGGMVTLTATVEPENAADKTVSWSAEPADAVTLKADGNSCTVTAERMGSATVTVTTVDGGKTAQCMVTVYDENTMINLSFIAAVEKAMNIGWDKNDDGTVSLTDANLEKIRAVTELDINGPPFTEEGKLTDLSGIEWFTGLTYLSCNDNNLTELDVSKNTALETLSCSGNQLTTLDVSKNTVLTDLSCSSNQLTTLDVSANRLLEDLSCSGNQLTTLDVSANTALEYLRCRSNQLMTLDVSANTALRWLWCEDNQLAALDVSKNTALDILYCERNQLAALDVSGCTALTRLRCDDNNLTELDVSKNTALETLSCRRNQLTSLDVSANRLLEYLYCNSNQLMTLDVSANRLLESLDCYSNRLTTLDVSANTVLTYLSCGRQTSDGTTAQTLMLTLNENQKTTWENEWKSFSSNDQNVVLTD